MSGKPRPAPDAAVSRRNPRGGERRPGETEKSGRNPASLPDSVRMSCPKNKRGFPPAGLPSRPRRKGDRRPRPGYNCTWRRLKPAMILLLSTLPRTPGMLPVDVYCHMM